MKCFFLFGASSCDELVCINSIGTCGYRTRRDQLCKKEEIKYNNIISQYKK